MMKMIVEAWGMIQRRSYQLFAKTQFQSFSTWRTTNISRSTLTTATTIKTPSRPPFNRSDTVSKLTYRLRSKIMNPNKILSTVSNRDSERGSQLCTNGSRFWHKIFFFLSNLLSLTRLPTAPTVLGSGEQTAKNWALESVRECEGPGAGWVGVFVAGLAGKRHFLPLILENVRRALSGVFAGSWLDQEAFLVQN